MPDPQAIAVCFAASVFPQRTPQLGETRLRERLDAFFAFLGAAQTMASSESLLDEGRFLAWRVAGGASADVPPEPFKQLCGDLAALRFRPCRQDSAEAQAPPEDVESTGRRQGSILFLATCCNAMFDRVWGYWTSNGPFVRYFRACFPSPPSELLEMGGDCSGGRRTSMPCWDGMAAQLAAIFPAEDPRHHGTVSSLERSAWNEACRWMARRSVPHGVFEFWDGSWNRVVSGFPYYSFQAQFRTWWGQCLKTHDFSGRRRTVVLDGEWPEEAQDADEPDITPASLRVYRELYRLVRATFFPRSAKDPAHDNEAYRRVVDELWYNRLQRKIDDVAPPELIKRIHQKVKDQLPDVTAAMINNLSRRVRMRMHAASLARVRGWRNAQVVSARCPTRFGRAGEEVRPLSKEKGILTIATLARSVPVSQTFLWAYTAHSILHPLIQPQRPEPWSWRRYVHELWWWVRDDEFEVLVRRAAEGGSPANQAALAAWETGVVGELYHSLRTAEDETRAEAVAENALGPRWCDALRGLVSDVCGVADPLEYTANLPISAWRRIADNHWIVPVWFAIRVEALDTDEAVARLKPDRHEVDSVVNLARAVREFSQHARGRRQGNARHE